MSILCQLVQLFSCSVQGSLAVMLLRLCVAGDIWATQQYWCSGAVWCQELNDIAGNGRKWRTWLIYTLHALLSPGLSFSFTYFFLSLSFYDVFKCSLCLSTVLFPALPFCFQYFTFISLLKTILVFLVCGPHPWCPGLASGSVFRGHFWQVWVP